MSTTKPECRWKLESWESDAYETSCGQAFCLEETLETNMASGFIYCPYCAGRIVPTEAEWQVREREEREAEEVAEVGQKKQAGASFGE